MLAVRGQRHVVCLAQVCQARDVREESQLVVDLVPN